MFDSGRSIWCFEQFFSYCVDVFLNLILPPQSLSKIKMPCKIRPPSYITFSSIYRVTLPTAEILSGKTVWAFLVCGFLMKLSKKIYWKYEKNRRSHLEVSVLNSTANPAHLHPNWVRLAVQFSRQLLNSSQVFFFALKL